MVWIVLHAAIVVRKAAPIDGDAATIDREVVAIARDAAIVVREVVWIDLQAGVIAKQVVVPRHGVEDLEVQLLVPAREPVAPRWQRQGHRGVVMSAPRHSGATWDVVRAISARIVPPAGARAGPPQRGRPYLVPGRKRAFLETARDVDGTRRALPD